MMKVQVRGQSSKVRLAKRFNGVLAAALIGMLTLIGRADAARVDDVTPPLVRPVAVRGGVLLLPLTARRPGTHWPAALSMRLSDGRTLENQTIWIEPAPRKLERRWIDDPRRLKARPIRDGDDSSRREFAAPLGPCLIARLPLDAQGPIMLDKVAIDPIWLDLPPSRVGAEPLPRPADEQAALAQPDLDSPFEHWRAAILAQQADAAPPRLDRFDAVNALLAEHFADLWMCGLARLGRIDADLARSCRAALTRTVRDGEHTIAAWVVNPVRQAELLTALLDDRRDDSSVAAAAAAWLDGIAPLLIWPEGEDIDRVRVAVLNRGSEHLVVRYAWDFEDELPLAVEVPSGVVTHIVIDRPPPPEAPLADLPRPREPESFTLRLFTGSRQLENLLFGPRLRAAAPPGIAIGPLLPNLSLAELDGRRAPAIAMEFATFVNLRRLNGRWEVFFECRRPAESDPHSEQDSRDQPLEGARTAKEARGIEAVTLLLGPAEASSVVLSVPEQGMWRQWSGPPSAALQVHRRSHADRWYCRIVLPESWLPLPGAAFHVGFARSHAGSRAVEAGPGLSVPWRPPAQRAVVNLDEWSDLP